jgi:hypothetical protein
VFGGESKAAPSATAGKIASQQSPDEMAGGTMEARRRQRRDSIHACSTAHMTNTGW